MLAIRYKILGNDIYIYIYIAIRSLTHTTSASCCLNDYSRHLSTKQLRHILGYVKLYYINNLNNMLKVSNRNKTSQNKIMGLTAVLLYKHIFYTLMIQLQHVHVTYKNFISDCLHHIILLLRFNVL